MTPREQKWCQRIILKNLRCGVQESTINKVWPGTIKSFAVALADTLKSEFVKGKGITIKDKVNYPVRVEPKLDGLRCIAVKLNGTVTFYTRNGSVLETLPKIKVALENGNYDNIVLDGEAAGEDWNESASVLMSKKEKKDDSNITYNVFDAVDVADWVRQKCDVAYSDRLEQLHNVIKSLPAGAPVRVVPHIMAKNETELKTYFAKCMDEEYEGVMLKTLDTPYKFKRSDNILKLKPCVTYEGVIVSSYEGRRGTKREGLFGGFEVVLPNGVITRLGGGFSDALKAEIQLNGPESYVGRIVELEAQPDPMTTDGLSYDGKARFPVFCRFRDPSDVDPKVMKAFVRFHAV
jgi:ATP-dependent DNA ligase